MHGLRNQLYFGISRKVIILFYSKMQKLKRDTNILA